MPFAPLDTAESVKHLSLRSQSRRLELGAERRVGGSLCPIGDSYFIAKDATIAPAESAITIQNR